MGQPLDPVVQHVTVTAKKNADDDVTVNINGRIYGGWEDVRITRGVERCPSDFELRLTDPYANNPDVLEIKPGDACVVMIGTDPVITGYVDVVMPEIAARRHQLTLTGRGKCCDLVDCSAEWPGGQISGNSLLQVASKLCEPYGITVDNIDDVGAVIPQFNLMRGETPFEIIERLARFRQLLAYDDVDGNLLLARVSTRSAASGLREGINVQAARAALSMHQRFSIYQCYYQAVSSLQDVGQGGDQIASVADAGVLRHRVRITVAEFGGGSAAAQDTAKDRVTWEAARRLGRSYAVQVTTDSWRDKSGALYEPNTLISLDLPSLKITGKKWAISEVVFKKSAAGTTCELLCMPPIAFEPNPQLISQLPGEFTQVQPGSGARP